MPGMPSAWIFACCLGVISRLIQTKPASPLRRFRSAATLRSGRTPTIASAASSGSLMLRGSPIERCGLDVGGKHLAVPVDKIGTAGGDRIVGVGACVYGRHIHDAEHREPADDDGKGQGEHADGKPDPEAHAVAGRQPFHGLRADLRHLLLLAPCDLGGHFVEFDPSHRPSSYLGVSMIAAAVAAASATVASPASGSTLTARKGISSSVATWLAENGSSLK